MEKQKEDCMTNNNVLSESTFMVIMTIITLMLFLFCISSCTLKCGMSFDVKEISPPLESQVESM